MAGTVEGIKALSGFIRTLLLLGVAGAVGWGGWLGYTHFIVPAQQSREALAQVALLNSKLAEVEAQRRAAEAQLAEARRENDRLQTAMKLLKIDRRLAHVTVVERGLNEVDEPYLDVSFVEVNQAGEAIGVARPFRLRGEKMFLDCWTVKFDDQYVEQADVLRGASLCIFRGIWGDLDGPQGSQSLDGPSHSLAHPPGIYQQAGAVNDFERQIWSDFWAVANNPQQQRELGIRANHGEAPYVLAEAGRTYRVEMRASGGVSLVPLGD